MYCKSSNAHCRILTDLSFDCSCQWVHSEERAVADDETSVSSEEGDEGDAHEFVSEGSADNEGCLASSMDSGLSSDEYEQFLSHILGDDGPGRGKCHKG